MSVYLHKSLVKAKDPGGKLATSADKETGSQLGGNYAARIQTGFDKKTNRAKYRYFDTADAYKKYVENQANTKKTDSKQSAKKLKDKTKREQERSSQQTGGSSLFVKPKKEKVKKSLSLFVEVNDE